jgi:hypothetical protein
MRETYGELLSDLMDDIAKFEDRPDIFRRNDIPRNHFYNVTNPNRESSSGRPYYTPVEWLVKLTRDSCNYSALQRVVKDCRCILITPEEICELEAMDSSEPEKVFNLVRKIVGLVKK